MKEQRMGAAISPVWCERRIEGEPVNLVARDLMKLVFQTRIFMLYAVSIWDVVQIFFPRGILWWKWGLQELYNFPVLSFLIHWILLPTPASLFTLFLFLRRGVVSVDLCVHSRFISASRAFLFFPLFIFTCPFNVSESSFWILHLVWKQHYKSLNKKIVW